jgi:hypothetical protein
MIAEPGFHSGHLAIGQQRHDQPALEIADDASIAMVPAEGPVVDASHHQRFRSGKGSYPHHRRHRDRRAHARRRP